MFNKDRKAFLQKQLEKYNIVSTTDSEGTIIYANDKFCEVAKYSREELLGKNNRILKSGIHPKALYTDLWNTISSGQTWRGDLCNKAKDGSLYWGDSLIIPELDKNGKPVFYHVFKTLITKRKKAEEELVEIKAELEKKIAQLENTNKKYQNLYNTTPEMFFSIDSKGIIRDVNSFGASTLGYSVKELNGKPILILFEDHLHQTVKKQLKKCLKYPQKNHEWEIQKIKKDRSIIEVNEIAWVEIQSNGSSILRIICKDITIQKDAEKALIAERNLILNGPTVVFQWSANKGLPYKYISPNVDSIFGYTAQDFQTKKAIYNNIIHPDDRNKIISEVKELRCNTLTKYEQEYRIIHKNGSIKWIRAHVKVTRNSTGRILFYNGHIYDITARHLARLESNTVKEQLTSLIEAVPDSITFKDQKGKYLIANRSALKLLGFENEEWRHKTRLELSIKIPSLKRGLDQCNRSDTQTWEAKKTSVFYENGILDDGTKINMEITKIPIFYKDGSKKALATIIKDITESKQKEAEITSKNAKLEQIAWMFSHEVRAPVATIMGLANIFNFEDHSDPINTDVLTRIRKPIDKLHNTISYIVKETNELDIIIPSITANPNNDSA